MEEEIKTFIKVELVLAVVGFAMNSRALRDATDRAERDRLAEEQNNKMTEEFMYSLEKRGFTIVKKEPSYEELISKTQ